TLSGTLYTGVGGILDPNFWVSVQPQDGQLIFYDGTNITIEPNGEIVSTTNNCSAVVQFFDGTAWSVGLVIITPQMVSYANAMSAVAGTLNTAIQMAGAGVETALVAGNLFAAIHFVANALVIANAAASMATGIQMAANAAA